LLVDDAILQLQDRRRFETRAGDWGTASAGEAGGSAMKGLVLLLALLVVPFSGLLAADEGIVSRYTSTAREKAVYFEEDKGQVGTGFQGLFRGFAGYDLLHLMGDERSWINIRYRGKIVDLYAATMALGSGTFPHKANDVVEWRGIEKGQQFNPYAIIYRLEGYDEFQHRHPSRLIVIKLDGERSAIIGHAEGSNEDAEAKRIADAARPR